MAIWLPEKDSPEDKSCFVPLESVAQQVIEDPSLDPVLPCEFMFMFCSSLGLRGTVFAYKHSDSRAYLFIDLQGQTYSWRDSGGVDCGGTYRRIGLAQAVQHLELHLFRIPRSLDEYCDACQELVTKRSLIDPLFLVEPPECSATVSRRPWPSPTRP